MAWALRARAPVAAGSLPRATRSAPKAGALRARAPTCAPRVTAHVVSWGGVGMSKTSCAARCSRGSVQGVLRAPAEGEGGVAHREDLAATASATLERSTGTVAHGKRAARERRRRRSKVSRRRRAGHAPPARRGRRVRVPRAFKRPAKTLVVVVVVRTPTPNYLRQASPDRGKYNIKRDRVRERCLVITDTRETGPLPTRYGACGFSEDSGRATRVKWEMERTLPLARPCLS